MSEARLWRLAQIGGVALMVLLLFGLVARSDPTLPILWNVAIPLVPATLLVSPLIWRNVCPLATLNLWTAGRTGIRRQTKRFAAYSGALGIVLFYLLVPARRFLFNQDGPALAVTIVAVAVLALAFGAAFDLKAGFCNAFCPVLPVERLYGQRPLLRVSNERCASCDLCSKACVDLAPEKSIAQQLGSARRSWSWMRTPFGAFAAALPGFILGYFTLEDVPLLGAPDVYLHILGWAAASYLLTLAIVILSKFNNRRVLRALAGVAAGLYYWFAAPGIADGLRIQAGGGALRMAALGLVLVWWWRAEARVRKRSSRVNSGAAGRTANRTIPSLGRRRS